MVKAGGQSTATDNGRNDNDTDTQTIPRSLERRSPRFEVEVVERPANSPLV